MKYTFSKSISGPLKNYGLFHFSFTAKDKEDWSDRSVDVSGGASVVGCHRSQRWLEIGHSIFGIISLIKLDLVVINLASKQR